MKAETDGDRLTDSVETNTGTSLNATDSGTSPLDKDSDDDNVGDWYEVQACYVIAGFVWFQGYNDIVGDATYVSRYEMNLVNYIKAIRTEFNAPNAPFVVATCGFDGSAASGNTLTVINAQLAVGDPVKYPEFAGNLKSVETRGSWRVTAQSSISQGYHYNRNAETFMLVGDAAGRAMIDLLATGTIDASAVPAADFHTVVVSIPKSLASGGKLFARLRVVIAP